MLPDDPGQQRVALLLAAAAVAALVWLWVRRRSLRKRLLDDDDRKLAYLLAVAVFYPATVVVHALGHVVAVRLLGGHVQHIDYTLLDGQPAFTMDHRPSSTAWWCIAIAGPLAQLGAVAVLYRIGWRARRTPALLRLAMVLAGAGAAIAVLLLGVSAAGGGGRDALVLYDKSTPFALRALTVVGHGAALLHCLRGGREHLDEVWHATR